MVVNTLAQNTQRAQAHGILGRPRAQQLADNGSQLLMDRQSNVGDQSVQSTSGLNHFPGHNLGMPTRPTFIENPIQ